MEVIMIALSDNLYFYKLLAPTTGLCHYGIAFYATNRALAAIRTQLKINFSHYAT